MRSSGYDLIESSRGGLYGYFLCIGRQQKRTDCVIKAIAIDDIESWVEDWYDTFKPSETLLDLLRQYILDELDYVKVEADNQDHAQTSRRAKLLKQQEKLLQAHYADAVPLELMKSEQKRISAELDAIDRQLASSQSDHAAVIANLESALEFTHNVGAAYQSAADKIRRQMNQAIFKRVLIDQDGSLRVEFTKLFELLLDPAFISRAQQHHQEKNESAEVFQLTDGEIDRLWDQVITSYEPSENQTTPDLIKVGGLKDDHLVGVEGLEPPTLSV